MAPTPLTGALGAAPPSAGQAPAPGRHGPRTRRQLLSQRRVPKGSQGTRGRDSGEKTEQRPRGRPWGAGRHLLGGPTATPAPASLAPPSRPSLRLLPETRGHGGHTRAEGARPSHPQPSGGPAPRGDDEAEATGCPAPPPPRPGFAVGPNRTPTRPISRRAHVTRSGNIAVTFLRGVGLSPVTSGAPTTTSPSASLPAASAPGMCPRGAGDKELGGFPTARRVQTLQRGGSKASAQPPGTRTPPPRPQPSPRSSSRPPGRRGDRGWLRGARARLPSRWGRRRAPRSATPVSRSSRPRPALRGDFSVTRATALFPTTRHTARPRGQPATLAGGVERPESPRGWRGGWEPWRSPRPGQVHPESPG